MSSEKPAKTTGGSKIVELMHKGVKIPSPESVEIGADVDCSRISGENVVIHSGSRIIGSKTLVSRNSTLGYEAPVTVENCQIGPNVELKGGFFSGAVFLDRARCGLGSHVRAGTILEEQASIAHTVALKQTILFPFVTLGSLINFCDCLMAGGTSRKNHSEVGSSYIHFNFTPSQDKATASLIGDVPAGVMLNQKPIFLGGQGGMVGPCRLGYGITSAAGTIIRKDEIRSDRLIMGGAGRGGNVAYRPGKFRSDKRIILNNLIYIANLIALRHWYERVRSVFISDNFSPELLAALQRNVDLGIEERINRLEAVCQKIAVDRGPDRMTKSAIQDWEIHQNWPEIKELLQVQSAAKTAADIRDQFISSVLQGVKSLGPDYIRVIQQLDVSDSEKGTQWLQAIIDDRLARIQKLIPSFF